MNRITPTVVVLTVALATVAFAQPASDHLACYGVKDPVRKGPTTLTVTNAGVTQSCRIGSRAQIACLETGTSNIVPAPRGGGPTPGNVGNLLCYKLFCPKPFPATEMTDDFGGTRVLSLRAGQFLCAPAIRGSQTTGSTSTSTTLAPGPCDFDSDSRRCVGTCGNGGHCSAVTSGGACECRTTPCGDADAPECNGFCSPGEACTFDLTGCSCFNIP